MFILKKQFYISFIILLSIALVGFGQSFSFQQFTTEDGLPGTTVYSMAQDNNKGIWIATDGGVCYYDGQSFHPFKEGNVQGEIIKLFHDSKDRLWMIGLSQQVSFFENGELFRFEKLLSDFPVDDVFEDQSNNYWFLHPLEVSVIIEPDSTNLPPRHQIFDDKKFIGIKSFHSIDENHNIIINSRGIHHFKNYIQTYEPFPWHEEKLDLIKFTLLNDNILYLATPSRMYSYSIFDKSFQPVFEEINHYLDAGINNLFLDDKKDIWIITRDGVIYLQKQKDGFLKKIKLLEGYATQSIFQDHEKNYWIATQQEGIFKLSSNQVEVFQNNKYGDRSVVLNSLDNDNVIVGYNNNWLTILDENLKSIFEKKISISNLEIYDIEVDRKNDVFYLVANFGIFKVKNKTFEFEKIAGGNGYKTCALGKNGELWVGNFQSFYRRGENGKKENKLLKRTYSIALDEKDNFWIGTVDGLYHYTEGTYVKIKNEELNLDIRDLQWDKEGILWIATQANGVFLYQNGKIINHLNSSNGLSSNNCHKILLDKKYAWVATNNGISKINSTDFSIEILRKDNGLPSNDVKDIHHLGNKIYAATNNGVAVFKKNFQIFNQPPHLRFTSILIENQDTSILPFYKLPHHQNNIKINFNGNTFKNANEVEYQFKMEGVDEEWTISKVNVASYPELSYGDYTFLVKTKSLNSDWSEVKQLKFVIQKAFWQTWWFYTLIAVFFLALGAGFVYAIFNEYKRRNEVQKNLTASQLTALRAQMDPHFLFNALNSIQDFIVQEDKRSANHYLSQFSKLMRNILDVSDKNKISLKKEINYLKLYLSLEALRFENNFEYNFEVDESINTETIFIPSMLIQPFVENAIKHGLMHKNGFKKLWIRFYINGNCLRCEIEDNGIGREAANAINLQNAKIYKSKAMNLTKERIDLLNFAENDKLNLNIIDLKNKEGKATGTKVEISIFQNFEE